MDRGNKKELAADGLSPMPVEIISGVITGLDIPQYDNGDVSYPTTTQEVYTFYNGVTVVATLTVNYTDATKNFLLNWAKT